MLLMEAHRQSTGAETILAVMATASSPPPGRPWHQLRALRKRLRLSQEKFGSEIGFTQGMISQLEKGQTDFTRTHLELIAKRWNVNPADLVDTDADDPNSIHAIVNKLPEGDRPRALEILRAMVRTAGQ